MKVASSSSPAQRFESGLYCVWIDIFAYDIVCSDSIVSRIVSLLLDKIQAVMIDTSHVFNWEFDEYNTSRLNCAHYCERITRCEAQNCKQFNRVGYSHHGFNSAASLLRCVIANGSRKDQPPKHHVPNSIQ